ncbi:MAG: protein translocase subunit SecD [Chloroflexota bacterium]
MRHIGWTVVAIVIVLLGAIFIDLPKTHSFFGHTVAVNKGIDVAGGARVLLCAPKNATPSGTDMNTARDVIDSRVSGGFGVSGPAVSRVGPGCISVEVPGLKASQQQQLINTIGQTGYLALTDAGTQILGSVKVKLACSGGAASGCPAHSKPGVTNLSANPPLLRVVVAGKYVQQGSAQVGFDQTGSPDVTYTLQGAGATAWCNYTSSHVNQFSAIVLDNKVVSDPTIQQPICSGGQTQITGVTQAQASQIATFLNYGALPVQLHIDSSQQVAASLGQQYIAEAEKAGIIGMIIVALFMLIYYRLPGLLADIALILYALTVFALFKYIGVTLTLAGIAGFILSIGMAVDANVLIFERMREELRSGKTLGAAVESGFRRAWPSIRDSNASTMITTVILFWFGHNFAASTITGFATTLFIGVAVSMATAVFVSHTFLRLLVLSGSFRNARLYGVEPTATGGSLA